MFRRGHYDLGLNNHQTHVLSGLMDVGPEDDDTTETARALTEQDFELAKKNLLIPVAQ